MPRALFLALPAVLGAATACDTDAPTAPVRDAPRPTAEVVTTSLATVLGKATVDDPGDVGLYTSLVSSSDGTQRVAYFDHTNYTTWRFKYAVCTANCTVAANWQKGVIDPDAAGYSAPSLKVRSGVLHVVYWSEGTHRLMYATCSSGCLLENNWKKAMLVESEWGTNGMAPSLAIGAESGRLYLSYRDADGGVISYATCLSGCTSTANWETVTVDPSSSGGYTQTSIALGPDGSRHVVYGGNVIEYAMCLASCTNPANWQRLVVDGGPPAAGGSASLAVDANGVRHVSYYDATNKDLKYARCAANCTNSAGWGRVTVDVGSGLLGSNVGRYASVAAGTDGKVHVSYYDATAGRLKYASCAGNCLQAASWSQQTVDGGCPTVGRCTDVGRYTSLRLGGGKVHISYYNLTYGNLKYAQLAP